MKKGMQDLMTFGRVISAAILVCGYLLLGVFLGRQLIQRGFPQWVAVILFFVAAFFGLWQGWIFVRVVWKRGE